MALTIKLDGSDIGTTRVRLRGSGGDGIVGLNASANGEGSQGGIVFEDPDSDFSIQGWMPITVEESDCTAAPRLFTGYVGDRRYSRGPYRSGVEHQVDTTIIDTMTLMSFLLIEFADGKRPAETHIQRIDWLLGSVYIPDGLVTDLGFVDRSDPRPFPATDYRGQYPAEVLSDLAGPIFRTWFTYWDQSAESIGLFFDTPTTSLWTSTLSISNDMADVDDTTTFAPYVDAVLTADPSEVYAKVRTVYRNGLIIENRASTDTNFFGSLGYRGVEADNDRIGLESTARAFANHLLDKYSEEAEVLTFTVRLPSSKVGLIDAGMRLGVVFTHLPGYETLTYVRIEQRTTMQTEGRQDFYDVELTCSNRGLTTTGGGGDPGGFPAPPCSQATPTFLQIGSNTDVPAGAGTGGPNITATLPGASTSGNLLVLALFSLAGSSPTVTVTTPAGWTKEVDAELTAAPGGNHNRCHVFWKQSTGETSVVVNTDDIAGTGNFFWKIAEYSLANPAIEGSHSTNLETPAPGFATGPSIAYGVGPRVIIGVCFDEIGHDVPDTPGADSPATLRTISNTAKLYLSDELIDPATAGSTNWNYSFTQVANCRSVAMSFLNFGCTDNPPLSGQFVYDEVPTPAADGTTTTFTLAWPFADGSLLVLVDRLDQTAAVTSYNGAAGTFTLAFAPKTGELIQVTYQGL